VICHNHPSGDPRPSGDDFKTTQQLVAAGIILGVPVKDHLIIARDEYFSFLQKGLILGID
jgi:DNA repair protein RadC